MPLLLVAGAFVSAGLFHVMLVLTGAARQGFEATFRALAYSGGATSMLQLVPLCGGYLYPFANLVYSVIALKEVHRTDLWRVVLAAVLMLVLCCGLVLAIGTGIAALDLGLGLKK